MMSVLSSFWKPRRSRLRFSVVASQHDSNPVPDFKRAQIKARLHYATCVKPGSHAWPMVGDSSVIIQGEYSPLIIPGLT